MFNRAAYQKQPFNRSGDSVFQSSLMRMTIGIAATAGLQYRQKTRVDLGLMMTAIPVFRRGLGAKPLEVMIRAAATAKRISFIQASAGQITLGLKAVYYAYGTAVIDLGGLVIAPGDELVIDTDKMTVTLNGVSVIEYVSMDSDFIQLLAGLNTIVYQDASGAVRTASVKIEWKPRWL